MYDNVLSFIVFLCVLNPECFSWSSHWFEWDTHYKIYRIRISYKTAANIVKGIKQWLVNFLHKGPLMLKHNHIMTSHEMIIWQVRYLITYIFPVLSQSWIYDIICHFSFHKLRSIKKVKLTKCIYWQVPQLRNFSQNMALANNTFPPVLVLPLTIIHILVIFNLSLSRIHVCSIKSMNMWFDHTEIWSDVKIQMQPMDTEHFVWFYQCVSVISRVTHICVNKLGNHWLR